MKKDNRYSVMLYGMKDIDMSTVNLKKLNRKLLNNSKSSSLFLPCWDSLEKDLEAFNLVEFKKRNFEDRLRFIDKYVEWLKKTPNKVWSKQQKIIIN